MHLLNIELEASVSQKLGICKSFSLTWSWRWAMSHAQMCVMCILTSIHYKDDQLERWYLQQLQWKQQFTTWLNQRGVSWQLFHKYGTAVITKAWIIITLHTEGDIFCAISSRQRMDWIYHIIIRTRNLSPKNGGGEIHTPYIPSTSLTRYQLRCPDWIGYLLQP